MYASCKIDGLPFLRNICFVNCEEPIRSPRLNGHSSATSNVRKPASSSAPRLWAACQQFVQARRLPLYVISTVVVVILFLDPDLLDVNIDSCLSPPFTQDILVYHMGVFADQRDGSELAGAAGHKTLQTLKLRTLQAKAVVLHVINKVDALDGCRRLKEELLRIEQATGWLNGERLVVQNVISLQQDIKRLAKKLKGQSLTVGQGKEVKALEKRVGSSLLGAMQEAMTIVSGKGVLERQRLMDIMGQ